MSGMEKGDDGRVAITAVGLILSAPASYVLQRALGAWGVLDPLSDGLGKWLKIHIPPATAGWTLALIIVFAIYGLLLWRVWKRPKHIHHVDPAPETMRMGDHVEAEVIPEHHRRPSAAVEPMHHLNPVIASARSYLSGARDTGLAVALGYALTGNWGVSVGEGIILSRKGVRAIERPLVRFRTAAKEGELRVWGKRESTGLYEKIDPGFWESNTVDPSTLISLMLSARTVSVRGRGVDPDEQFHDIMVNRAEVERVWPHAG